MSTNPVKIEEISNEFVAFTSHALLFMAKQDRSDICLEMIKFERHLKI